MMALDAWQIRFAGWACFQPEAFWLTLVLSSGCGDGPRHRLA